MKNKKVDLSSYVDKIDDVIDSLETTKATKDYGVLEWDMERMIEYEEEMNKIIAELRYRKKLGDLYVDNDPSFFKGENPKMWTIITYSEQEAYEKYGKVAKNE